MSTALARFGNGLARLLGAADRLELEVGPWRAERRLQRALRLRRNLGDRDDRRPFLPAADRVRLLPVRRAARQLQAPRGRGAVGRGRVLRRPVRRVPAAVRLHAIARRPSRGSTRPPRSAGSRTPWGCAASAARCSCCPTSTPSRSQNLGASFRFEFRRELLLTKLAVSLAAPPDLESFPATAPVPELRKLPGRFYPINYLFVEITNACNFKCTWCPDEIMDRRRGFMKKERVFRLVDEIAQKRSWLGPIFPVKLHQMGEPMLHPELPAIVAYAEERGVPIELNTNCGLITEERVEALYRAGSHQPDPVLPDARRGDVQDAQGPEARVRRVPRQGAPGARAQGRARRAHPDRDRHHEHEVRRRLPDRERGRAGARSSCETGSSSAASSRRATTSRRASTTSRRSAPRTSSTRTRTAAATSCWTACI